jgi:large subunit ribosomal protein L15
MAIKQHLLKSPNNVKRNRKRVGRGDSSGNGSYSGKGMKGQNSRSGGGVRPGFEGGQLPLIKKLSALRGFNNIFRVEYNVINLKTLQLIFQNNAEVNLEALVQAGVFKNTKQRLKILGSGDIDIAIHVSAHKFSRTAEEKIKAAGGSIQEIK